MSSSATVSAVKPVRVVSAVPNAGLVVQEVVVCDHVPVTLCALTVVSVVRVERTWSVSLTFCALAGTPETLNCMRARRSALVASLQVLTQTDIHSALP
ncbi:hypothetical protein DMB42_49790 [Nonomuraea sp. WAC 01424]|nr:hypothetical protein DMB42_49790 [Nonomuraea sp. WAC 01424]